MQFFKWNQYAVVDQHEDGVLSGYQLYWIPRQWDPWLLHLTLLTLYSVLILLNLPSKQQCSHCFSEDLLNPPIVWEERTYLTNIHTDVFDPYSRANPDVDEAWDSLIDTHITTITEQEKQSLPGTQNTARAFGGRKVTPCSSKSSTRSTACDNSSEINHGFADPEGHSDHCFSYLLQTLMCHADVGVMKTTWVSHAQVYMANFNVTKQCRNYDVIHNWAQTRKAKHVPPPRHKGVDSQ